jgi:hypothetical protein
MKRALPMFVLSLFGCSGPASMKITLAINEPRVVTVEIEARPTGDTASMDILDCQFLAPAAGATLGTRKSGTSPSSAKCTLDASMTEWTGCTKGQCAPISFIIYGSAGKKFTIAASGIDAQGTAITAVSKDETLPPSGEVPDTVTLPVATFPSCSYAINGLGDATNGESFVAPVPSTTPGQLEIYAVTGKLAGLWSYAPKGSGCALTQMATAPACAIQPNTNGPNQSVVVGNVAGDGALESVAMCSIASPNGYSFVVAPLQPSMMNNLSNSAMKLVLGAHARASTPVLADIGGTGKKAIVMLTQSSLLVGDLSLKIWMPDVVGTSSVTTIPLTGITNTINTGNTAQQLPFSPIVYPVAMGPMTMREGLLITGYEGGYASWDQIGGTVTALFAPMSGKARRSEFAPSLTKRSDGSLIFVERLGLLTTQTPPQIQMDFGEFMTRKVTRTTYTITTPPVAPYAAARQTRIAIGDVNGDGSRIAVMGENAQIFLFPIGASGSMGTATVLPNPITTAGLTGGLTILLANLDGQTGLDIIAYNQGAAQIYAVDRKGNSLPGFPLTADISDNTLRVALADLDGDGAMELLTLVYNTLKVYTLGPGSYHKAATPWPLPYRDLAATSADLTESDPLRP